MEILESHSKMALRTVFRRSYQERRRPGPSPYVYYTRARAGPGVTENRRFVGESEGDPDSCSKLLVSVKVEFSLLGENSEKAMLGPKSIIKGKQPL